MKWLLARFSEPSTWAGLTGLIPAAVQVATAPTPAAYGAIVAGLAAVLMKEGQTGTAIAQGVK